MAITHVGVAGAASTSATLPSFVAGDLALVLAWRSSSNTLPTAPAGWTEVSNGSFTNTAYSWAYKVLTGSDTTTGTWTNATDVVVSVYRGAVYVTHGVNSGASATPTWPAVLTGSWSGTRPSLMPPNSGLVYIGAHKDASNLNAMTLSGMTNRTSGVGSGKMGVCDLIDADESLAAVSFASNGTAVSYVAEAIVIRPDVEYDPAANGNAAVTTGWTNAANAQRREQITTTSASAAPAKNATIDSDYSFADITSTDIPDSSTINSVKMSIYGAIDAVVTGGLIGVQGRLSGANSGTEATKATTGNALVTTTLGTVALSDLRAASTNLKARVRATKGNTASAMTGTIYLVRMEVSYTAPAAAADTVAQYIGGGYYP